MGDDAVLGLGPGGGTPLPFDISDDPFAGAIAPFDVGIELSEGTFAIDFGPDDDSDVVIANGEIFGGGLFAGTSVCKILLSATLKIDLVIMFVMLI